MNTRRFFAVLLLLLAVSVNALATDAGQEAQLAAVWLDQDAIERRVTAALVTAEASQDAVCDIVLPLEALPELTFYLSDGPLAADEVLPQPLTVITYEHTDALSTLYILQDEVTGRLISANVRLGIDPGSGDVAFSAPDGDAGEQSVPAPDTSVTPGPSATVTVIAHYQTADGVSIADDDQYQAQRGTTFSVYAHTMGEGWISQNDQIQFVDIPMDATGPVEVTFLYARPTPTPPPPDVRITVHYRDIGGIPVASDTSLMLAGGTEADVYAAPEDLKEHYVPTSESVQRISVNAAGEPQEVIFFYTFETPATPAPAYVRVQYLNAQGDAVAADGQLSGSPGQQMTIFAAPEQLEAYYVLADEESKPVTLSESGTTVTVSFLYRYEPPETPAPSDTPLPTVTATPQPAPVLGFVQVSYVYQGNDSLNYSAPETVYMGENVLSGAEGLRTGYRLVSAEEVTVDVDENGQVSPNQVTFLYAPENSAVSMPELIVQYFAENGAQVATSTLLQLQPGENTVYATPVDLMEGYEQITPSYTVTVSNDGVASDEVVTFYYKPVQDGQTTAGGYQVLPANGYARSKNDSVNLRSEPTTDSDANIIGKISKTDLIQILGTATNHGKWYYVSVNERQGYVSASVVTELSDADAQVLLSLHGADTGDDTLADPETGLIERWAQINKRVWFRDQPNGKKIQELRGSARVFVDEATDVDGTLWYQVRYNGKRGYVMAEYLNVYSAAESQSLQFSLPSAVPTHTPAATRVPTSTPTAFVPTPSPTPVPVTPTPVSSATPLPYSGYAVTNTRAVIRSGLSTDNPALVTLNGETLVMIQGQTYVNGVCWDSVRVISSGITGFVEDDRLYHVTNDVAQEYLETQSTPTPVPTPENTPLPFTGYALILVDGVPLRQQANSNASYLSILSEGAVISVLRQSTSDDGSSWCLIQSGMYLGYVRRDLLRAMTDEEIFEYLESIKSRPTPTPAVTPTPRAQSAMDSCWGIVKPDHVQLRSEPSMTTGTALRLMSRNEFLQVQGSFLGEDEQVWHLVQYNGLTGYIRADYVQILAQGELTSVVTSDDFKSANTTETTVTGVDSIQSYETFLVNQWTNPSLSASFQPFDPYTTPVAVLSVQSSETTETAANPTPTVTYPPTPQATIIVNPDRTPLPNAEGGSHFGTVLIGAGVIAALGGAGFAWASIRGKKRRQALQRAQAIQRRQRRAAGEAGSDTKAPSVSAYRRDATESFALKGTARPIPRDGNRYAENPRSPAPESKPDTPPESARFRRPESTAAFSPAHAASAAPASDTPQRPGRQRRTERNHYDEDGN